MTVALPDSFLARPIAHRGLHDRAAGRVENSLASISAAADAGYGIEIDLQCTRDDQAVVFHDYDLKRLTFEMGPVAQRSAAELGQVALRDDAGTIPTLTQVLEVVAGRVPLLVEIKDQDGQMGHDTGKLGAAVAAALDGYEGDVALMSFNPHHIVEMARLCPDRPRGLVTDPYRPDDWPTLPRPTCERLAGIPDFDHVQASFISHNVRDLDAPRVIDLKRQGARILCWTVRSAEVEAEARKVADNVTFEGYTA